MTKRVQGHLRLSVRPNEDDDDEEEEEDRHHYHHHHLTISAILKASIPVNSVMNVPQDRHVNCFRVRQSSPSLRPSKPKRPKLSITCDDQFQTLMGSIYLQLIQFSWSTGLSHGTH